MALDVLARGRPDLAEAIIPGLLAADQPRRDPDGRRAGRRAGRPAVAGRPRRSTVGNPGAGHASRATGGSGRLARAGRTADPALERQSDRAGELDAATREGTPAPGRSRAASSAPRPCWRSSRRRSARRCWPAIRPRSSSPAIARARPGRLRQELPDLPPASGARASRRTGSLGHRRPGTRCSV